MIISKAVSIHPYFRVHTGKLEFFKKNMRNFVEKTRTEPGNLFYDFTVSQDEVFCREAYESAAAVLAHLENVGELLGESLKIADLIRLEFHGPAEEIEKLKEPLAHLNPAWFIHEHGLHS